ncbi:MAG: four helix bundle protein [Bacteroidota bacterium]
MPEVSSRRVFDLEERSFTFAKNVALFCRTLAKTSSNIEYAKQLIRSSASIGANYTEANDSLGKKDFMMRIKICRRESKESGYWLRLIRDTNADDFIGAASMLINETVELKKIFSSILQRVK